MTLSPVLYLLSYAASLLGNSISAIALPLIVLQSTGSLIATGTVALTSAVPAFLVGLAAGVVIDRINRRTASVVADLISAASMAALPLIDQLTALNLGWFIVVGIVGAVGDIPGLTAREAMLPAVVRAGRLTAEQLLGLRESIGALMVVVGPAMAGTLMALLPGTTVLWITAATSLGAAVLTLCIPHHIGSVSTERSGTAPKASAWAELLDGWRAIVTSAGLLRASTALSLMMVVVIAAAQGLVLPAHFAAQGHPSVLGFVLSALAAGTLVGGGAFALLGARIARRVWFVASIVGSAFAVGLLGTLASTEVIVGAAAAFGLCAGALGSLTGVLMLEQIPEAMRGRILSTQNSLIMLAAPVGIVAVSAVGERFGLAPAAATLALVWAIAAIVALVLPSFRAVALAGVTETDERGIAHEEQ